jgi:hypothetical protein
MSKRYIVYDNYGPMTIQEWDGTPRGGVLFHGDTASVMPYSTARRAMKRTAEYAARKGFKWECHRQRVMLIQAKAETMKARVAVLEGERDKARECLRNAMDYLRAKEEEGDPRYLTEDEWHSLKVGLDNTPPAQEPA